MGIVINLYTKENTKEKRHGATIGDTKKYSAREYACDLLLTSILGISLSTFLGLTCINDKNN